MKSAPCLGQTDIFFPDEHVVPKQARAICRSCPFVERCLNYALDNHISHGVWGNTTPKERTKLRRLRRSKDNQTQTRTKTWLRTAG